MHSGSLAYVYRFKAHDMRGSENAFSEKKWWYEPFRLEKFHKAPSYRLDSSYHLFVLVNDKLVVKNLMNFPKKALTKKQMLIVFLM